jgi:hypothetical protein
VLRADLSSSRLFKEVWSDCGRTSQLGLVKRESERQRLMREDMEMELEGIKNHLSIVQAALEEASARSADDILEAQFAREEAER